MENGWSSLKNCHGGRGHNGNYTTSLAWDLFGINSTTFDGNTSSHNSFNQENPNSSPSAAAEAASADTLIVLSGHHHQGINDNQSTSSTCLYGGGGGSHYYHRDPHLVCLNLGKRHYFEDATPALLGDRHVAGSKRGKPYYTTTTATASGVFVAPSESGAVTVASPAAVPRCQVDGCYVALVNAKDYHRRHKVCEMHSKAPKVMVLGLEQRFCQQCSRFHAVSEFDDAKRSCRRRLAGHNERRRKSSHDPSGVKNPCQGRALSLLSSKNNSWTSSADLSSKCSAALHELILENRAAILARQIILNRDCHWHHHQAEEPNNDQNGTISLVSQQHPMFQPSHSWDRLNEAGTQVTLDLMETPTSAFGFLSVRGKSKVEEEEEDCSELWSSFGVA